MDDATMPTRQPAREVAIVVVAWDNESKAVPVCLSPLSPPAVAVLSLASPEVLTDPLGQRPHVRYIGVVAQVAAAVGIALKEGEEGGKKG